jgi:hypothetical protein
MLNRPCDAPSGAVGARFALQVTIATSTRDKLRHAQELLSHSVPSGDLAVVLDRALDALIAQLEKRKFAATSKPRPCKGSTNPRYIPANVKRAVHERDGGRCTFVSDSGKRCDSRARLEYDHIDEVARGLPTVDGVRLRCRAHNQYTAEQTRSGPSSWRTSGMLRPPHDPARYSARTSATGFVSNQSGRTGHRRHAPGPGSEADPDQ